MAAGLGFKDFVTGEVLTAADVDGYLMQGVWVFASAAARDAAVTSPQEGNFAYLKDTNVTTYYTGSAWANLDTTGMTNPMTTTGDIIYSSPGSTPVRLGIGTANQVLTVNSGATAPEWKTAAGGSDSTAVSLFVNQSISNATSTNISWATEYYDSSSFWSSGSTITIPTTGKYFMIITMRWPTSSAGWRSFALKQNGTNQWLDGDYNMSNGGSLQGQVMTYSRGMSCTASDTIVLETYQNSGGSLTADFTITIIRLGA